MFKEDCQCLRQWRGENLPAFLASTLRHLGIDFLRKRRAERKQVLNWPDVGTDDSDSSQTSCDLPDPEPSPETRLLIAEMSEIVKATIAQLSERDQELIQRHYLAEQTYDEIATEMSLTISNVGVSLKRARERLKAVLLHQYPDRFHEGPENDRAASAPGGP